MRIRGLVRVFMRQQQRVQAWLHTVRLGFGLLLCLGLGLLMCISTAQAAAEPATSEDWNAHFQSTYVWQHKPALRLPYAGPNSLRGSAETSYSLTGTAAFGLRLAPSTALYADAEAAQGRPLSGLLGLAGFSNGELAKTAGSTLKIYRARLFVRHTISLGDGSETGGPAGDEAVESQAHQLAGTRDKRRLVITLGNVSVLDIFDDNAVAHDPRTQFMNWALMTHAAYDYPADSRGYTNGLAVEYIDAEWALLAARMAQPRDPNGLPLDNHLLRHWGDQIELTRQHDSGAVRLLAFRSRAVMARYADALAASNPPALDAARDGARTKWGIGANVEQRIGKDLGMFLRAMRADGKTETYAFTEADRSLSAGLSLQGAAWQRAGDTVGLALAASALSAPHRNYLARGGISFFLGDGRLRYALERLLEMYYSAALGSGFTLTADWQRIANPGYNADRGPASFYALRLHWEL